MCFDLWPLKPPRAAFSWVQRAFCLGGNTMTHEYIVPVVHVCVCCRHDGVSAHDVVSLFQLVMEYCLGSASDLLEGRCDPSSAIDSLYLSHVCVVVTLWSSRHHSSQKAAPGNRNSCHYPWCIAGISVSSLSQHDSQVRTSAYWSTLWLEGVYVLLWHLLITLPRLLWTFKCHRPLNPLQIHKLYKNDKI